MSEPTRYVDVNGRAFRYARAGSGPTLVLLHGGLGSIDTLDALAEPLRKTHDVIALERRGHGATCDLPGPINYDEMLRDTIEALDALGVGCADVVGYSDGAVIGLLLARSEPRRVRSLVSISGNFHYKGVSHDVRQRLAALSPHSGVPASLSAEFMRLSPHGPEHFPLVFEKVRRMWLSEPTLEPHDLCTIACRTLVMTADRDVIEHEHTLALFRALAAAELAIVPGTTHDLIRERPGLIAEMIRTFVARS